MAPNSAELELPPDLLGRASRSGNEYAWRVHDIPEVIEAARAANLVSVGGQLQFWLPGGGVVELYWIGVDTYRSVDSALSWKVRVERTAEVAARDFAALQDRFDFISEGRAVLDEHTAGGHDPADTMWFVWYVLCEGDVLGP
ncbi:MAG TPA: hypothetical protein VE914_23990 [Candidatus Angelobacter sp.]|nr:hypothetical protein [Candidatus Angelobacter sp.]